MGTEKAHKRFQHPLLAPLPIQSPLFGAADKTDVPHFLASCLTIAIPM